MNKPNRFIGINYLDIDARMAVPPAYWLRRLHDFDPELVVFPSQQVPFAYVLARKARRTGGINAKMMEKGPGVFAPTPDTRFCVERRMLPVTLIYRHNAVSWSIDNIIAELKARDIWAVGGAAKAADLMDARDDKERQKIKDNIRQDFWNRSGEAWRSYQARTGARVSHGGTAAQAARRDKGGVIKQPSL